MDVQAKQVKSSLLHTTYTVNYTINVRSACPKDNVSSEEDAGIYNIPVDYWLNELYSQDSSNFSFAALNLLFSRFQEKAENAYSHRKKEHKI